MEDGVSNWNEAETTLSTIESTQENIGIYSWAYYHWHCFLYGVLKALDHSKSKNECHP